ncbi:siderophore biosynthesis protein [Bacillus sp. AFS094611]|uniref:Siderophore biosynthesis protein n=1 Tax=Bacillus thuringiensis serovar sooncheon TaxID=180891 RepID=A0A9Q5SHX6_BACTU|nr:siderophore biosynthesis protein [Bacillus thuringiensis serovar coreanensis]OTX49157.1 siderophore biosynthesis protein [Bacillus thuringiensis serovar sooncheon]OTX57666.1 siderophore biosynthesis protein [Bacillus thuringiensis serovar guiyangiensis]OTX62679.1 siderophore biosynthesis protein [Bacillus thuringiensis serovar roskildiensis]PDZ51797.1 siderophore biosynthesis protein [Bacillus sp. AFS094611]
MDMYHMKTLKALESEDYILVRRRVLRQLVESLIYEGIITPVRIESKEQILFLIQGLNEDNKSVTYECYGRDRMTFGRISIDSLIVRVQEEKQEIQSVSQFLEEVFRVVNVEQTKLDSFIHELEQTICKDTIAQYERQNNVKYTQKSYDDFESHLVDGHPYHPSYKARIGFQYRDNFQYGYEFMQPIKLIWIAAHKKYATVGYDNEVIYDNILKGEVDEPTIEVYMERIYSAGCDPKQYVFIPVHPWQWENFIIPNYADHIQDKNIIYVGKSADDYCAQQSMRTLRNITNPKKPYVKLSLNILNTSTLRTLKPYSVASAPAISNWLSDIVSRDSYLRDESRVILLKEFSSVTYDANKKATYGSLGCIWRESIHNYLDEQEDAIPFNGLYAKEKNGTPIIDTWLKKYGIESWLRLLIQKAIIPVIHLVVEHGIALESHGQNMILVHKEGLPIRIALKDFHEGLEFYRPFLKEMNKCPDFTKMHKAYTNGKMNDFFEMDRIECLQEMVLDALFLFNVGELAFVLADEYEWKEESFWMVVFEEIENHFRKYPNLKDRFESIQLYTPTFYAEQLTKRRLYMDVESLVHEVPNPLYRARELNKQKSVVTGGNYANR